MTTLRSTTGSAEVLENMTIRELVEHAYERGEELTVGRDGVGPGLTLYGHESTRKDMT